MEVTNRDSWSGLDGLFSDPGFCGLYYSHIPSGIHIPNQDLNWRVLFMTVVVFFRKIIVADKDFPALNKSSLIKFMLKYSASVKFTV